MTVAPAGFGGVPALLLGGQRCGRLGAQGRSRMQCSGPPHSGSCAAPRSNTGAAHNRLPRPDGAAVNRLAGNRRGTAGRHARTRRLRRRLAGNRARLRLLQPCHHVGPRWNYRTCGRLACQGWPRRLCSNRQARCWSPRSGGSCRNPRSRSCRRRWCRTRRRWRQRLTRSRKNLARARSGGWRRHRPCRNRCRAQRRMQRCRAARCKRRTDRGWLRPGRFFRAAAARGIRGSLVHWFCERFHYGHGRGFRGLLGDGPRGCGTAFL